jgi:hypothetical protein
MAASLDELIQRADLDGLVRHVDDACSARDWDHVLRIRNEARSAVATGRQLWPIATLANFRLALWAPAHLAVRALDDTARTFMPGPVSEILAVHHSWSDLEPHLEHGHDRSLVAYERSLRADVIEASEPAVLEIPFALAPWEPRYATAGYNDDGVVDEMPSLAFDWQPAVGVVGAEILRDDTVTVFAQMMSPWTSQSEGSARSAVVEGGVADALGALGVIDARVAPLSPPEALAWLTWAASSGGAHGKRRGVATGRSEALWLLSVFTGLDDDWPVTFEELGEVIGGLEFHAFTSADHPAHGWWLQMAIVDAEEGLALSLMTRDAAPQ